MTTRIGDTALLHFSQFDKTQAGIYICVASNFMGTSQKEFIVETGNSNKTKQQNNMPCRLCDFTHNPMETGKQRNERWAILFLIQILSNTLTSCILQEILGAFQHRFLHVKSYRSLLKL